MAAAGGSCDMPGMLGIPCWSAASCADAMAAVNMQNISAWTNTDAPAVSRRETSFRSE